MLLPSGMLLVSPTWILGLEKWGKGVQAQEENNLNVVEIKTKHRK